MPAFVHTTGPIFHYIEWYQGNWAFLGTSETSPEIQFRPRTLEVRNDLAGRSLPFQRTWDGQDAIVKTVLTYFDNNVLSALLKQFDDRLARGSLFIGVQTYRLILQHSFAGTQVATPGMRAGWRFHAAWLAAYSPTPAGAQAQMVGLVFQCDNLWDPGSRSFILYDQGTDIATKYKPQ